MIGSDFNVEIRYTSSGNRFTACKNISSYISGITAYLDWKQTDSWYDLLSNDTLLRTHVSGDLTVYLLAPDFPIKNIDHYTDIQTDFTV